MTSFSTINDAFLSKILEDEWELWTATEREEDWKSILLGAIPWFKFPRQSLDIDTETNSFISDLSNEEIQILATYMKCEWLNRTIMTWENVKPLYDERDFSQANLLDKFKNMLEKEEKKAHKLESIYYRSINYKPFDYKKMATRYERSH